MKKSRISKIVLYLMLIIPVALFVTGVKADSGFDSSWDSGGSSWDSGSSWGSSSSWDSSGYSYGSSSGGSLSSLIFIIGFIIVIVILTSNNKNGTNHYSSLKLDHSKEIPDSDIAKILGAFDKAKFMQDRFQDFMDIQNAWMNFDYKLLKKKLTDEIYNQYEMQLDTLKVKNQKNIMEDFSYFDSMITDIIQDKKKVTITMELVTSFYDYLVDNDNKVIRGNKTRKNTMHYELIFVCNLEKHDKCPNCGAKLPDTGECEYCHTIVPNVSDNWVMSKKEAKRQE